MPLDRERQERLYADHLYPIECGFERHGGEDHFEAFIRHYLTLRTGEVPKQGEEYAVFRTHARSRRVQEAGPEKLAGDLRTCADHYRAIVLGEEPDPELAQAFRELARLEMKPVFPFLLHLYGDYAGGRLSKHDLITLTRLVTAYAMRRAVCGYKPAALPPVFARAPRAIEPDRYVESVRAHFLSLQGAEALGLEPGKRVSAGAFEKLLQGHVIGTNIRLGRLRDGQHEHRPGQVEQLAVRRASLSPCLPDTLAAWRFARNRRTGSRTVIGERSAAMGYTLGQAATAAGKSKTTILRAIQKSKIYAAKDVHGNWSIDPDELHRVYPAVTEGNGGADDHATTGNGDLRAVVRLLEGQLEELRQDRDASRSWRSVWCSSAPLPAVRSGAACSIEPVPAGGPIYDEGRENAPVRGRPRP